MTRKVRYTNEFVDRFRELSSGQRSLVESSLMEMISAPDPTAAAHHLERRAYYCNWSHRVRGNLLVVFSMTRATLTFLSVGTHAQAYRPKA